MHCSKQHVALSIFRSVDELKATSLGCIRFVHDFTADDTCCCIAQLGLRPFSNKLTRTKARTRGLAKGRGRCVNVEDIKGAIPVAVQPPQQPRRKLSKAELREQAAAACSIAEKKREFFIFQISCGGSKALATSASTIRPVPFRCCRRSCSRKAARAHRPAACPERDSFPAMRLLRAHFAVGAG